jgi:hypothetical protein
MPLIQRGGPGILVMKNTPDLPIKFYVSGQLYIAIAKSFFQYGNPYNPPCPPL